MDEMNEANRRYWDAQAADWQKLRDEDGLWRECPRRPEVAFDGAALALIRQFVGDLRGRRACVIGSGDNYVAFALAGMGARVTSTDISVRQLEAARGRAGLLGLEMEFLRADATRLDGIADESFDLVCSSNGLFVWIAEPGRVFQQVYRVLKPGGFYIFYDVHPFQRPWKDQVFPLEMEKPYGESGPFEFLDDGYTNYQFHWRMGDLLNPLAEAGLELRRLEESHAKDAGFWVGSAYTPASDAGLLDWRNNPRTGLPVWMTVAARKPEKR